MPYISFQDRGRVAADPHGPKTPGELNYAITRQIKKFLENQEVEGYVQLNAVMGALESAKLEFYRRIVVPYEDDKIIKNGDVY